MPRTGLRARGSSSTEASLPPLPPATRKSSRKRKSSEITEETESLDNGLSAAEQIKMRQKYEGMLEEFDTEVQHKIKQLRSHAEDCYQSIRTAVQAVELAKLPKNIRSMTVREFKEKYGGAVHPTPHRKPAAQVKPTATRPPLPPSASSGSSSSSNNNANNITLSLVDGLQIDLSKMNPADLDNKVRMEIFQKLASAMNQIQSFIGPICYFRTFFFHDVTVLHRNSLLGNHQCALCSVS